MKLQLNNLSYNQLKGTFSTDILALVGHNCLNGSIPPEINNMRSIEVLDVNLNTISGSIPSEIAELVHLKKLSLDENYFTENIPPEIEQLYNPAVLSIPRVTRNTQEGKQHVLTGLKDAVSLIDFELAGNTFSGKNPARLLKNTLLGSEKITMNFHDN